MKKLYQTPAAEVIDLEAMQSIALIADEDGSKPGGDSQWVEDGRDF